MSDEELELEEHHAKDMLNAPRQARLASIETQLDQCWDLLGQRRARRLAGMNSDEATVRPEEVIERYLQ